MICGLGVGHHGECCRFGTSVVFVAMTLGDSESVAREGGPEMSPQGHFNIETSTGCEVAT